MSEGDAIPPKQAVVTEAHEVGQCCRAEVAEEVATYS